MADYSTHITSEHKWRDLNLKEVWRYRDLIGLFTRRTFVVMYKQTILGPAWIFLTPLFNSVVQAFVFGGIAGIGTDGGPYAAVLSVQQRHLDLLLRLPDEKRRYFTDEVGNNVDTDFAHGLCFIKAAVNENTKLVWDVKSWGHFLLPEPVISEIG